MKDPKNIFVTTGDLKQDYQVIGPIYFQVSNKGIFSNALSRLLKSIKVRLIAKKRKELCPKRQLTGAFFMVNGV